MLYVLQWLVFDPEPVDTRWSSRLMLWSLAAKSLLRDSWQKGLSHQSCLNLTYNFWAVRFWVNVSEVLDWCPLVTARQQRIQARLRLLSPKLTLCLEQEAQGLGALLDKMEDNDHINWKTQRSRCIFHSKTCCFRDTKFLKIWSTLNDPRMTLTT